MLKKLLRFVLTGFGMFALASTTDKWMSKLRPKNLIIRGKKVVKLTSIILLFQAVFILSLTPAKADHENGHWNNLSYDWLTWWQYDWFKYYTSWCYFNWDNERLVSAISYNNYFLTELESAEEGCTNTFYLAHRILQDKIKDKKWSYWTQWENYTGTHDAYDHDQDESGAVNLKINFLEYGDDENFAVWFADNSLESVFVSRLSNRPTRGTFIYSGHVGFRGFGHRKDLRFATVNFESSTVTINTDFKGFKSSETFDDYYSISSAPLSINENGFFGGDLVGTYRDTAGRFFNYTGYINGYLGGDGGNLVVALYTMQGSNPTDFLIGSGQ